MKLSWGFILSSLYCSASATNQARVYVHDSTLKAAPQQPPSVAPETARLILAQRLGLSRFHSIKDASEETIQHINTYGGRQQRLFGGADAGRTKAHVLIWVEDVEDATAVIQDPSAYSAEFTVTNPPNKPDNERLIQDLALQAEAIPKYADPKGNTYTVGIDVEAALSPIKRPQIYNDYLSVFHAGKADELSLPELSHQIALLLSKTVESKEDGFSMTVVLMPPSSSHSKRSAQPYGTYIVPKTIGARREKTEAPLTLSSSKPSTSAQSSNLDVSDIEDFPIVSTAVDDSPVLGILPACFESQSACERQTHNCSGHGSCKVLHPGKAGERKDCYGCACVPTVQHVGEDKGMESKRSVTNWGGPACQKKDVSVPFFLLAGSAIFLAFLLSSGIGLLYSVGSEELPSVIGAGVSGPVRK